MDRYKVFPSGEMGMHPAGNWTPYADAQATVEALQRERDQWREAFERSCDDTAHLKAALTATSQPAQEQCSYCKRPLTDNHSFSYGVPGVPRVYKCDRADCTKPATSQEGQHG